MKVNITHLLEEKFGITPNSKREQILELIEFLKQHKGKKISFLFDEEEKNEDID